VEYIKSRLDTTGYYDTYLQTFPHFYSEGTANFSADGKSYTSEWFTYGPAGKVTAPLVSLLGLGCVANDFAGVENRIAVVYRGSCDFGLKVAYAGAAGAKGVVIINNVAGTIGGGTLVNLTRPEGPYVPAASISRDDGAALVTEIAAGEVTGTLSVVAVNEERYSSNVIAQTKGGDKKNVVMAGGHTDSVPAGPVLSPLPLSEVNLT
jgi:Zn-dependent M28 family amino/carboxypeptidase